MVNDRIIKRCTQGAGLREVSKRHRKRSMLIILIRLVRGVNVVVDGAGGQSRSFILCPPDQKYSVLIIKKDSNLIPRPYLLIYHVQCVSTRLTDDTQVTDTKQFHLLKIYKKTAWISNTFYIVNEIQSAAGGSWQLIDLITSLW